MSTSNKKPVLSAFPMGHVTKAVSTLIQAAIGIRIRHLCIISGMSLESCA